MAKKRFNWFVFFSILEQVKLNQEESEEIINFEINYDQLTEFIETNLNNQGSNLENFCNKPMKKFQDMKAELELLKYSVKHHLEENLSLEEDHSLVRLCPYSADQKLKFQETYTVSIFFLFYSIKE